MGGLIIFAAICGPLPGPLRPRHRRASPSSASPSAAPRSASPTTTSRSSSAARSGSRRAGSCPSRSRSRSASGGSPATRSGSTRASSSASATPSLYLGPVLYVVLVFLVIAGAQQRRQPHRRPRRPRRRLLRDRPPRLHGDHVTNGQEDLALLSACLVGACVGFLWFNSFPASIFMGDTGSLGLGGAIGGARGDDPDRGAADHHRRHLRDRGALGRDPGLLPSRPSAAASS